MTVRQTVLCNMCVHMLIDPANGAQDSTNTKKDALARNLLLKYIYIYCANILPDVAFDVRWPHFARSRGCGFGLKVPIKEGVTRQWC